MSYTQLSRNLQNHFFHMFLSQVFYRLSMCHRSGMKNEIVKHIDSFMIGFRAMKTLHGSVRMKQFGTVVLAVVFFCLAAQGIPKEKPEVVAGSEPSLKEKLCWLKDKIRLT